MASVDTIDRRRFFELEEQVKLLKKDNTAKDDLIRVLSSMEVKEVFIKPSEQISNGASPCPSDNKSSGNRELENKLRTFEKELNEKASECDSLQVSLREVQRENQLIKESFTQQTRLVDKLMKELQAAQDRESELKSWQASHVSATEAIQSNHIADKEKIKTLERRIKQLNDEREKMAQENGVVGQKFDQFFNETAHLLGLAEDEAPPAVLTKLSEMIRDNANLRARLTTLNLTTSQQEDSQRQDRESRQQLSHEVTSLRQKLDENTELVADLREEASRLDEERRQAVLLAQDLEQKCAAMERSLHALTLQQKECEVKVLRSASEQHKWEADLQTRDRQLQVFIESLASMLSMNGSSPCPATESAVKERVKILVQQLQDNQERLSVLDQCLKRTTHQEAKFSNDFREKELQLKYSETKVLELQKRVQDLEKELGAFEAGRDALVRGDKELVRDTMKRLARVLQIDDNASLEVISEKVMNKVEQQKLTNVSHLSALQNLEKQHQQLKDNLAACEKRLLVRKEKMGLLKKRLQLVSRASSHRVSSASVDAETHASFVPGDHGEVDSLRRQLNEMILENEELRARQYSLSPSYADNMADVRQLQMTVDKLERVRRKQAEKVQQMLAEIRDLQNQLHQSEIRSQNLMQDAKSANSLLAAAQRREKQLSNLRLAVGTMLGVRVDMLAIPDYEILRRLEVLIAAGSPVERPVAGAASSVASVVGSSVSVDDYDNEPANHSRLLLRPCLALRKSQSIDVHGPRRPASTRTVCHHGSNAAVTFGEERNIYHWSPSRGAESAHFGANRRTPPLVDTHKY